MIKIKQLIIIGFCFFLNSLVFAEGDNGQAGALLRYGVGGRAMGMGRAYVAAANDASAIYWNPSGIVGSSRPEFTSMYTNLYYDSQYTYFGIVYPRILQNSKNSFIDFLFGKWTALGMGWTGLSSTEYNQRTDVGEELGQFGIQENAFYLSWAREAVNSYGIFKYGLNFKMINQSFPGLINTDNIQVNLINRDWSTGFDFGLQFQPIHAPVFKLVSLRYLLPLRFGINLQNIIPPQYDSDTNTSLQFPLVIRMGMNYQFNLNDWIPTSWYWLYDNMSNSYLITTMDWELINGNYSGRYWGLEGVHPVRGNKTLVIWRTGINSQSEGPVFGMGLEMPFTGASRLRLDYSYGTHPYLPEDSRFFMTFKFGPKYDDQYFYDNSQNLSEQDKEWEQYLLKTLVEYPNSNVRESVEQLATVCDSSLIPRYFDLIGGLGRAEWLMRDTRRLLRIGKIKQARKKAFQAVDEYQNVYRKEEDNLSDRHLLNYGEALVITDSYADGVDILSRLDKQTLKSQYLIGTSHKKLGQWNDAIESFSQVTKMRGEIDHESIVPLAFLGWGESLMGQTSFESAIEAFKVLLSRHTGALDDNYPRYPLIFDKYIQDEAQYLIGLSHIQLNQYDKGVVEMLKVLRYYPDLDYGLTISNNAGLILQLLKNKSWNQLSDYVDELYAEYLEIH